MLDKMSRMQIDYENKISEIKETTEAAIKRARAPSQKSSRSKSIGKASEGGCSNSDLVREGDDFIFGGTDKKKPSNRDSILKPSSTIKSKGQVGYHPDVHGDSHRRGKSFDSKTRNSPNNKSEAHSHRHSFDAKSSFITDKSFRVPITSANMSKNEAAIVIQKHFRGYQRKQDFKLVVKNLRGNDKEFLFKVTVLGSPAKILTCSMHMWRQQPVSLDFIVQEMGMGRRPNHKFSIDLKKFEISDGTGMREKVRQIIFEAVNDSDLQSSIADAFNSQEAFEILSADVCPSDRFENFEKENRESSEENLGPEASVYQPTKKDLFGEVVIKTEEERQREIDAEI